MKPHHGFIAERSAAQHCAELLRQVPKADPLPALARFGARLAQALPAALAPWHGGLPPQIACGAVGECDATQLTGKIAPLAANCLLAAGTADHPLLLSIGAPAVFSLIDRAFGGRGAVPEPLPDAFPASGSVLIERIERLIAARIAGVLAQTVHPLRRESDVARLAGFTLPNRIAMLEFTISGDRALEAWSFLLAVPLGTVNELLGESEGTRKAPRAPSAADPAGEPFGEVPLQLRAVLVEVEVPVATLAALQVGSILPVSVARKVPLRIAGRTIAHGAVGELDDRAALQILSLA